MALKAIDAFAGGGGLTVGLKRAGFQVVAAIETDGHAYNTYKANHPEVHVIKQDIRTVSGESLLELVDGGQIDLLAGCPPCQGFTSLTSKYRRQDERNTLVLEMGRLVEEMRPNAVMMENVPGLARKGTDLYDNLKQMLCDLGYILSDGILEVADYGVPQCRKRLVLLGGLNFPINLPSPTHSKKGLDGLKTWRTVRDAIGKTPSPMTLREAKEHGKVQESDWHIVRSLSAQNIKRIRCAKAGEAWTSIPEEIRPKCHKQNYLGFTNVYGRMEWERPSPTITGGCTTFSKGRFGHPVEDRTISVREAATLQTFPVDYRFDTPYMEHVCNIVGNALPCDFAEAVSCQCQRELTAMYKRSGAGV